MKMQRVRIISSALAIIALAFGLFACQDVGAPAPDISSPQSETTRAATSAPQRSRAKTQPAADVSKTHAEEEDCPLEEDDFFSNLYFEWKDLIEELDVDTVNKPKNYLVTPYGVKSVYDPH